MVRHSAATRCTVTLGADRITIADDGRGMRSADASALRDGHGLSGLRERAAADGAQVVVETPPSGGFRLSVVAAERREPRCSGEPGRPGGRGGVDAHTVLAAAGRVAPVTIRLLLADDQALVRGALATLLDLEPDMTVVAEVGRGDEVVAAARESGPTSPSSTSRCPAWTGSRPPRAAAQRFRRSRSSSSRRSGGPGSCGGPCVAGANGFVVKDTPARQLADAVRRVNSGLRVVDPTLAADSLAVGESPLTARETEVLRAARDGGSVSDIAGAAFLSEGTVRNHLSAAIGKTGARNRADAVRIAEENGWL